MTPVYCHLTHFIVYGLTWRVLNSSLSSVPFGQSIDSPIYPLSFLYPAIQGFTTLFHPKFNMFGMTVALGAWLTLHNDSPPSPAWTKSNDSPRRISDSWPTTTSTNHRKFTSSSSKFWARYFCSQTKKFSIWYLCQELIWGTTCSFQLFNLHWQCLTLP